jgi:dihydroflavonol-4-reductase
MLTLVTGATGLVGNNVVRLLLERGERVRVLVRSSSGGGSGARALENLPVEIHLGDICRAEAVREACRGVQRIVHAAAQVQIGWTGLETQRLANVGGTRNVVAAAATEGARLLYVSTVNALGLGSREHPADEDTLADDFVPCPYVITKREAERAVLDGVAEGLDAVVVNPAFMLGPWDWKPSSGRMMLQVATGWAKLAPPGGNDFCDVRDVAAGILAALDRGTRGRRYILSGEYLSFLDAWRMFARIVGVPPPWFTARRPGLWLYGHAGDLWGKLIGREPELNSAAVEMAKLEHHYSYARAAAELDYRPRSANEAAESAWAWFREHGYA